MKLRIAQLEELDKIEILYQDCINRLNELGIYQWTPDYPNKDTFMGEINSGSLYLLEKAQQLIGAIILNELQSDEWSTIPWQYEHPLIVHALVVSPNYQGKGYGQLLIDLYENHAKCNGYQSIRLDAFSENPVAYKMYKKNNYEDRGTVIFKDKPEGHQYYICLEKEL